MKSSVHDVLPSRLKRSLVRFGSDLATARRKRRLTVAMMAERTAVSKGTYARIERGDPSVSMGAYAMAMFVLGFGDEAFRVSDPARDETGLLLEQERLPKRVRPRKSTSGF